MSSRALSRRFGTFVAARRDSSALRMDAERAQWGALGRSLHAPREPLLRHGEESAQAMGVGVTPNGARAAAPPSAAVSTQMPFSCTATLCSQ